MKRLALILLTLPALAHAQATPSLSSPSPARDSIPLREYVDIRFAYQDAAVQAALASADRAVSKAEAATEKRFDSVNEFRSMLNDNTRTLMPRAEAEQAFKAINEKLETITGRVNSREDQTRGAGNLWGYLVGAAGLGLALVAYLSRGKGRA